MENIQDKKIEAGKLPIESHNKMLSTIDGVIQELKTTNEADLEIKNAIKHLLEASARIHAYYVKINTPKNEPTTEDTDE